MKEFAEEFFRAVGRVLISSPLEHLGLTHVEFGRGPFDVNGPNEGYAFVPVVVTFDPEEGPFFDGQYRGEEGLGRTLSWKGGRENEGSTN